MKDERKKKYQSMKNQQIKRRKHTKINENKMSKNIQTK